MIILNYKGYASDLLHDIDLKQNPHRHYLMKEKYSPTEAMDMCHKCCKRQNWNKLFIYDPCTDSYIKLEEIGDL